MLYLFHIYFIPIKCYRIEYNLIKILHKLMKTTTALDMREKKRSDDGIRDFLKM